MKKNIDILNSIDGKTLSVPIASLKLHRFANEHPKMTEIEFQRLKESINVIGQLEPIIIYRDKIVDGRHRFWAFEALGLDTILVKEIPSKTPLATVKEIVFGSEVRRHQSATQKAIKAWWTVQEEGITYRVAEAKFMTSRTMISACKYISDVRGNDLLKDLYKGVPVVIGTRKTNSLRTAQSLIKEQETAALDARFEEETHVSIDRANEEAKPFLDSLSREPLPVIERVAKGAYRMLKERE